MHAGVNPKSSEWRWSGPHQREGWPIARSNIVCVGADPGGWERGWRADLVLGLDGGAVPHVDDDPRRVRARGGRAPATGRAVAATRRAWFLYTQGAQRQWRGYGRVGASERLNCDPAFASRETGLGKRCQDWGLVNGTWGRGGGVWWLTDVICWGGGENARCLLAGLNLDNQTSEGGGGSRAGTQSGGGRGTGGGALKDNPKGGRVSSSIRQTGQRGCWLDHRSY